MPFSDQLIERFRDLELLFRKFAHAILQLCAISPLKLPELVEILQRDLNHIRKRHIVKMLERGE